MSRSEVESCLAVGLNVLLAPNADRESTLRYRVVVRGWQPGHWIWLEVPEGGEKVPSHFAKDPCVLRFIRDGRACGFTTDIIQITNMEGSSRFGSLRVAWPENAETVAVRKSPRVGLSCPCEALTDKGRNMECEVQDISEGGCGILWTARDVPATGATLILSFTLPGGIEVQNVSAVVRSIRGSDLGSVLGCEFFELDEIIHNSIRLYLLCSIEAMRGKPNGQIVILEQHADEVRELVASLRDNNYEVVVASHVLYAVFWLVNTQPYAFFVNQQQDEMEVEQLCRLIRKTPGLEEVPIFVFGRNDERTQQSIKEAGATDFFPTAMEAQGALIALRKHAAGRGSWQVGINRERRYPVFSESFR